MGQPVVKVFEFCPRCGAQPAVTGTNPFKCDREGCGFTHYFSPITAVGAIVADAEGRILLITREKDPGKGKLGLPGGFVDPGETLEEACQREVLEEINLTATSMTYLTSFPNTYDYLGVVMPVTDGFFVCQVETFDGIRAQEGEVSAWCFVHPTTEHLDNLAFDSNRRAVEFYLNQLSATHTSATSTGDGNAPS